MSSSGSSSSSDSGSASGSGDDSSSSDGELETPRPLSQTSPSRHPMANGGPDRQQGNNQLMNTLREYLWVILRLGQVKRWNLYMRAFVFCAAANLAHSLPVTMCYHTAFLVLWSFIFCSPQEMTFSSASQAVTAMTTELCWSVSLSTLLLLSAWLTCFFAVIADPSCVGWFDYIYFFLICFSIS